MTSVPAADAARKDAVLPQVGGAIDVVSERELTHGARLSHHFNAAGSALPTATVVSAVIDHLRLEERVGGYEAAAQVKESVEAVYRSAASLLSCQADEIALFDSASTGLRVLLDAFRPAPGSRIIASRSTYVSHALHLLTLRNEHGVELVLAPTDALRRVDLDALEALLADGRPTILSIAHVPTSSGLVEPAEEIGRTAARYARSPPQARPARTKSARGRSRGSGVSRGGTARSTSWTRPSRSGTSWSMSPRSAAMRL